MFQFYIVRLKGPGRPLSPARSPVSILYSSIKRVVLGPVQQPLVRFQFYIVRLKAGDATPEAVPVTGFNSI